MAKLIALDFQDYLDMEAIGWCFNKLSKKEKEEIRKGWVKMIMKRLVF